MDQVNTAPAKKAFNWKLLVAIVVALLLVAGIVVVLMSLSGGKTSPIAAMQKLANAKDVKWETLVNDMLAGSDGGKASKLVKLMKKSETLGDTIADWEEAFADAYEDNADEYGSNFKIVYKNDKTVEEKLEKDDVKDYRNRIKDMGEDFAELGKALGKLKSSDLKDLAEDLDMSTADLKELIQCLKDIGSKYKGAEVSEGWEMEVLTKITGSELDDPEEDDFELYVLKVNGKWVNATAFSYLYSLYYTINNAVRNYL